MSNLDQTPFRCWTGADLPVYGRTSTIAIPSAHRLEGDVMTGAFIGMTGFAAVKAPGTSAWRPPDC